MIRIITSSIRATFEAVKDVVFDIQGLEVRADQWLWIVTNKDEDFASLAQPERVLGG